MASSLTSTSFLLTPKSKSRPNLKNKRLRAFAKGSGPFSSFGIGKYGDNGSSADDGEGDDKKTKFNNPFGFKFGKVSDVKSLVPVVSNKPSSGLSFVNQRRKDPDTVFVAGATGQAGIRIAQTLLRQGFTVRAGVPDLDAAQELARFASQYKIISKEESKRLNAVESSFEDAKTIAKAIGNATKVVVTIGPTENGPTTEVTTLDALQVIQAAELAGTSHMVIIYDDNTVGSSTKNVLDGITSFFNNLFAKSQPLNLQEFMQKVIETDVKYTLIKTSLTDDFSTEIGYNVVVSAEGSSSGVNDYKVAKSQIASLVAKVFSNTAVAENKVVEVFTDPSAPPRPIVDLFSIIPEDGRRKAYAEAIASEKAVEEAKVAAERAREAADSAKKLEEQVKQLNEKEAVAASLAQEAQVKADAAGASMESLLSKAKGIGSGLSWEKLSSQISENVQKSMEKPKVQIATVRSQAKARNMPPQKAVVKKSTSSTDTKPKEDISQGKTEKRKVFGGLFTQETIYVDDD